MFDSMRLRFCGSLTAAFVSAQAQAMDITLPPAPLLLPDTTFDYYRERGEDMAPAETFCLERDSLGWRSDNGGTTLSLQADGSVREPTLMVVLRISLPDGRVTLPHRSDNCYGLDGWLRTREDRRHDLQHPDIQ